MTPIDWTQLLEHPALKADVREYTLAKIEGAVRDCLAGCPAGQLYSTVQLVEMLFPEHSVRGPQMYDARRRLFTYLISSKSPLDAYRRRAPETEWRKQFGRTFKPWLWSKP